jgi:hypothetical protein
MCSDTDRLLPGSLMVFAVRPFFFPEDVRFADLDAFAAFALFAISLSSTRAEVPGGRTNVA